jgi:hypothetical protein
LGIWGQIEIILWENEMIYFRVRLRGCPLLTLGNPPKILKDDAREDFSTSKPSKKFDKSVCSRMIE